MLSTGYGVKSDGYTRIRTAYFVSCDQFTKGLLGWLSVELGGGRGETGRDIGEKSEREWRGGMKGPFFTINFLGQILRHAP